MFGDTEFKLIWKNCIQPIAQPDPLEGVVVEPIPPMKAVMENVASSASCAAISSLPFPPEMHTCAQAYSPMRTQHMSSYAASC